MPSIAQYSYNPNWSHSYRVCDRSMIQAGWRSGGDRGGCWHGSRWRGGGIGSLCLSIFLQSGGALWVWLRDCRFQLIRIVCDVPTGPLEHDRRCRNYLGDWLGAGLTRRDGKIAECLGHFKTMAFRTLVLIDWHCSYSFNESCGRHLSLNALRLSRPCWSIARVFHSHDYSSRMAPWSMVICVTESSEDFSASRIWSLR